MAIAPVLLAAKLVQLPEGVDRAIDRPMTIPLAHEMASCAKI
jgi:hypothetical protein